MTILRRIKNLWEISAYRINRNDLYNNILGKTTLTKDFPTIEKRPAIIIKESEDFFKEEEQEL